MKHDKLPSEKNVFDQYYNLIGLCYSLVMVPYALMIKALTFKNNLSSSGFVFACAN